MKLFKLLGLMKGRGNPFGCVTSVILAGEWVPGHLARRFGKAGLGGILAAWVLGASLPAGEAQARLVLEEAILRESDFVRIHAAEALVSLGWPGLARDVFGKDEGDRSPRLTVGAWRVLAQAAETPEERSRWTIRLEEVVLTADSPERFLALESLNKLKHSLSPRALAEVRMWTIGDSHLPFVSWARCLAGEEGALEELSGLLNSGEAVVRLRAAYALRSLRPEGDEPRRNLTRAADLEPPGTKARTFLISAALTLKADESRHARWRAELEDVLHDGSDASRYEACQSLMLIYAESDLPRLVELLEGARGDPQVGAAWAILHILKHSP